MAFNILVVDDSDTVRAIIAKTLRLAEVPINELREAANGEEALAILKDQWIDLVFSDINMPVMTGMEMIERMHEDENLRSIPVVVVSTEGSKTRIEDLIQKGVRAYIRKPFTPEILKDIVEKVLGDSHA